MINPILLENFSDVIIRPCVPDESRPPWCRDHTYQSLDPMRVLGRELIDFGQWIELTKEEKAIRAVIVKRFSTAVSDAFPNYRACLYGSTACNTSLYNGDIDMCIFPFTEDGKIDHHNFGSYILESIRQKLEEYNLWESSKTIGANVPIIKGIDKIAKLNFDISFNGDESLLNIERNLKALELYPALFPVLMLLKVILYEKQFIGIYEGGISSNMLFSLVLSIIQMAPPEHKDNPAMILMIFLATYGGSFNFFENMVSTIDGGRVVKKPITKVKCLQIVVADPQNHSKQLCGKYSKHKEIIEFLAALKEKLSKPYVPFESFIGRLVSIKEMNKMENERKRIIKDFFGVVAPKPERKMSWPELSKFVVAQSEAIRRKNEKQEEEEKEKPVFWQSEFMKNPDKPKSQESFQQHNRIKPRQTNERINRPSLVREKKQIKTEKEFVMKMLSRTDESLK